LHSRTSGSNGMCGTQVSGDGSWMPHKYSRGKMSRIHPFPSFTGMEEYVDGSWERATVIIVSTWLWVVEGVCERGEDECVRDEWGFFVVPSVG